MYEIMKAVYDSDDLLHALYTGETDELDYTDRENIETIYDSEWKNLKPYRDYGFLFASDLAPLIFKKVPEWKDYTISIETDDCGAYIYADFETNHGTRSIIIGWLEYIDEDESESVE